MFTRDSLSCLFAGLSFVLAGCPQREVAEVVPTPAIEQQQSVPIDESRNVDILFVVDNSGSMSQEQASLVENFPKFMDVLENIVGGRPDMHIAVTSTDVGGPNLGNSGCSDNPTVGDDGRLFGAECLSVGTFIRDISNESGGRNTNYPGELTDTFACMAELGTTGCGFEQPLAAMKRALEKPENSDFLRADAVLAVVFITDEDDCSAENWELFGSLDAGLDHPLGPARSFRCFEFGVTCDNDDLRSPGVKNGCEADVDSPYLADVSSYIGFLRGLKEFPDQQIFTAAIAGKLTPDITVRTSINESTAQALDQVEIAPSCVVEVVTLGDGTQIEKGAAPPYRIKRLLDGFGSNATSTEICERDLSGPLQTIADALARTIYSPCVIGQLEDSNPSQPGLQPDCSVWDVIGTNEEVLPRCDDADVGSNHSCFDLVEDLAECNRADTPSGLRLDIYRPDGFSAPFGSTSELRCVGTLL